MGVRYTGSRCVEIGKTRYPFSNETDDGDDGTQSCAGDLDGAVGVTTGSGVLRAGTAGRTARLLSGERAGEGREQCAAARDGLGDGGGSGDGDPIDGAGDGDSVRLVGPAGAHASPCAAGGPPAVDGATRDSDGGIRLRGAAPPATAVSEGASGAAVGEGVADGRGDGRVRRKCGRVSGAGGADAVVQLRGVGAKGLRGRGGGRKVGGEAGALVRGRDSVSIH